MDVSTNNRDMMRAPFTKNRKSRTVGTEELPLQSSCTMASKGRHDFRLAFLEVGFHLMGSAMINQPARGLANAMDEIIVVLLKCRRIRRPSMSGQGVVA